MESSNQIIYQCNHCEYKSNIKSNLTRHIKAKHPEKLVRLDNIQSIIENQPQSSESNPQPEIIENQNIADEQAIDMDDYINQLIQEKLKENQLPPVKVPKDIMKSMFTGTVPTFIAGGITGYILSQILPGFFFSIKQKALLVAAQQMKPQVPPPATSSIQNTNSAEPPIEHSL